MLGNTSDISGKFCKEILCHMILLVEKVLLRAPLTTYHTVLFNALKGVVSVSPCSCDRQGDDTTLLVPSLQTPPYHEHSDPRWETSEAFERNRQDNKTGFPAKSFYNRNTCAQAPSEMNT